MEEKETKNKFWKGVLVGALVTAFAGFAVVGFATGIWIIGRRTSESQSIQATGTDANKLDMKKIEPKLQYMEALIDKYFLFDENMTEEEQAKNGTAEDWIYRGYMSSLNDPYSVYYDKDEYTSLNLLRNWCTSEPECIHRNHHSGQRVQELPGPGSRNAAGRYPL